MFNIIKIIKERSQNKLLKSSSIAPVGEFLNIKEVRSVGFIYNINSNSYIEDIKTIIKVLNQAGVLYAGLAIETKKGFLPSSENVDNIPDEIRFLQDNDIVPIENLHLSWVGVPTSSDLDKYLDKEFDLFFDFNIDNNFTLEYVTREVKAKCVVGMTKSKNSRCNIVIDGENGSTLSYEDFLKQAFHYLSVIQSVRK